MNKKLRRLLQPSFRLHFFVLICFVVAAYFFNPYLSLGFAATTLLLFIYTRIVNRIRQKEIVRYVDTVTYHVDTAAQDSMINFPLPMVVVKLDSNEILWANELFNEITGTTDHVFEVSISDVVPEFQTKWIMEGKSECPFDVNIGERSYTVYGSLVLSQGDASGHNLLATFYWVDVTDYHRLRDQYADSRLVTSIIVMDNYEEVMKNASYPEQSSILAKIDNKITEWVKSTDGIIRRYERDRYLFLFEERYLEKFVEGRFAILDSMKEIMSPDAIPVTVSIGISKDAESLKENYHQAALAIDMALSRGGDQAVIKTKSGFSFYGGRSKELEKRTKVKSRVMANALSELIADASNVLVMGHKVPDIDAIGAAAGVMCAARKRGKTCRIVTNIHNTAAKPLIDRLTRAPEYREAFISSQEALLYVDTHTLLVVVDVNRPEYTETPELLDASTRVAVIDHHRRAATYIDHAALNFHEPYASSTCELVTELLQYIVDPADILRYEAEGLLAGIVLDTKNFSMRTGVRTFEAAAFLRRAGADTIEIKRLFQNELQSCIERYEIIRQAKIYKDHMVVAALDKPCDRIVAAQAADELLNIVNVQASFVLFPAEDAVVVSARSLGVVNVQVILEKLGGGGHMITAGAQLKGVSWQEAQYQLLRAIDQYLEENPHIHG